MNRGAVRVVANEVAAGSGKKVAVLAAGEEMGAPALRNDELLGGKEGGEEDELLDGEEDENLLGGREVKDFLSGNEGNEILGGKWDDELLGGRGEEEPLCKGEDD